jgi:hypothetical protein
MIEQIVNSFFILQKKANLTAIRFLIDKKLSKKRKITTSDNDKKITKPF